jgi:hypothetical protein
MLCAPDAGRRVPTDVSDDWIGHSVDWFGAAGTTFDLRSAVTTPPAPVVDRRSNRTRTKKRRDARRERLPAAKSSIILIVNPGHCLPGVSLCLSRLIDSALLRTQTADGFTDLLCPVSVVITEALVARYESADAGGIGSPAHSRRVQVNALVSLEAARGIEPRYGDLQDCPRRSPDTTTSVGSGGNRQRPASMELCGHPRTYRHSQAVAEVRDAIVTRRTSPAGSKCPPDSGHRAETLQCQLVALPSSRRRR